MEIGSTLAKIRAGRSSDSVLCGLDDAKTEQAKSHCRQAIYGRESR